MRSLLSKSTVPPELGEQFEVLHDKMTPLLNERKEQFKKLAKGVKEMTDTAGWKQVLGPFLKRHGDPNKLFGKTPEEYAKLEPTVAAYAKLLKLVENLLTLIEDDEEETSP